MTGFEARIKRERPVNLRSTGPLESVQQRNNFSASSALYFSVLSVAVTYRELANARDATFPPAHSTHLGEPMTMSPFPEQTGDNW